MNQPINIAIVGLGKMGISHLGIANATPSLKVTAVCDSSSLVGQMIERYCKIPFVASYDKLIASPGLQAVVIATPTRFHEKMVEDALERGLHVFCEKPMTLSATASERLAALGQERGRVCQVGYHNRFVGTFGEVRRLLDLGAIGRVRHVHAEAYGPVVLKPTTKTWRSTPTEGGGALYDYAAHPINMMNWYVGEPLVCGGAELAPLFSADVDDAVYANLRFANGATGQVSVNWSDETHRKMTTRLTLFGDKGKITVDRQELQIHIGANGVVPDGYQRGWTVKYITELTPNVGFYLRGEEYSAQIAAFGDAIQQGNLDCVNDFASAAVTDKTLEMIRTRALAEPPPAEAVAAALEGQRRPGRGLFARVLGR